MMVSYRTYLDLHVVICFLVSLSKDVENEVWWQFIKFELNNFDAYVLIGADRGTWKLDHCCAASWPK